MKEHIKKLSILFLLATLFASCDAEEMYLKEKNSNNGEPVIKTLSYKEAGETFNRLKNELKIEKHLKIPETSNLQARTIKDTLGFLIETDLIKQVTLGEYKSYTMKLVKEIEGNIFFNLTIEDKNGESSMFMTCYIPSSYWVNNKDEAFQGVMVSRRMNTLTQYQEPEILFDDIINSHFNHDLGVGPGGGGTNQYNQNYPYNCNGIVIVSVQQVAYQCGCGHWPDQICGGCPQADPYYPGYNQVPFYYCQEDPFYSGSNPDNPTNPSTGGPSSPTNPDDTSITAMIKPEECKERIVGDLNRDCQLSPYETCLLGGNSQEVCDCVNAGGKLIDCIKDDLCDQLKKIANSPNFADRIAYLKTKAAGSKEHAWAYKYFSGTNNFAPPTVVGHNTDNQNTVNLGAFNGTEWLGAFHNHTSGEKPTIKMFSPGDLKWLFLKAVKKNNYQAPSVTSAGINELFLGLVNINEVYCLKIKDWSKFYTLKNTAVFEKFEKKLENSYKISTSEATQITLQKDFLKVLKELDLGIGLYEQNINGNWDEINLDATNNNTVKIPCP